MSTGKSAGGDAESRLVQLTTRAGKNYGFDERHDPARPVDWWFQESTEGLVLFTVFYTQACRWSLCTGCNLPSVGSQFAVSFPAVVAQIDSLFAEPALDARLEDVEQVIVSNNGSVLDQVTFPSTALMYLIAKINLKLPRLRVLSLETRVEYVDMAELEFLSRAMKEREQPAEIELAVGFEAFSDRIRNDVFLKGLSTRAFEELVEKAAAHKLRLKCYFMQKPIVGMTDESRAEDIQQGIDYLASLAAATTSRSTCISTPPTSPAARRSKRASAPASTPSVAATQPAPSCTPAAKGSIYVGLTTKALPSKEARSAAGRKTSSRGFSVQQGEGFRGAGGTDRDVSPSAGLAAGLGAGSGRGSARRAWSGRDERGGVEWRGGFFWMEPLHAPLGGRHHPAGARATPSSPAATEIGPRRGLLAARDVHGEFCRSSCRHPPRPVVVSPALDAAGVVQSANHTRSGANQATPLVRPRRRLVRSSEMSGPISTVAGAVLSPTFHSAPAQKSTGVRIASSDRTHP
jgi:hypothetical protein